MRGTARMLLPSQKRHSDRSAILLAENQNHTRLEIRRAVASAATSSLSTWSSGRWDGGRMVVAMPVTHSHFIEGYFTGAVTLVKKTPHPVLRGSVAHRDIGDHSVWLERPAKVSLSGFITAHYPEAGTVGSVRQLVRAGGGKLPEDAEDFGALKSDPKRVETARDYILRGPLREAQYAGLLYSYSRDGPLRKCDF